MPRPPRPQPPPPQVFQLQTSQEEPPPPKVDRRTKYPFGWMQPRNFFVVPAEQETSALEAARNYRQRHRGEGWDYSHDRDGAGQLRIWRIS